MARRLPPPKYRTQEETAAARREATRRRQATALRTKFRGKRGPAEQPRKPPNSRREPSGGPIFGPKRKPESTKSESESEKSEEGAGGESSASGPRARSLSYDKMARKRLFGPYPAEGLEGNVGYRLPSSEEETSASSLTSRKTKKISTTTKKEKSGMSNMLLPLLLMRGGLGNQSNDAGLKALHEQNEKDKVAAKEAIDKMKSLMVTLQELKDTVQKEHEKLDKRNKEKGCNCPSNSKIEKKVEELSDRLEESDVVEALEKCRKTLKIYKDHLEKLHKYSFYLKNLTLKIQQKLKHNIRKAKTLCSNKRRKKSTKKK
tara:strand:- start:2801 stop:3751 length:951 start_codon:yes stop_codon:yes gene_type:complete